MKADDAKDVVSGASSPEKAATVTVVLTPGRSGSSLLMEILGNLGSALSDDLIPGRLENPHGFFEDAQVVEIHKGLMSDLGVRPGRPMPEGWLDQQVTRKAKWALTDLVRKQTGSDSGNWAIKDPRISELLPLWLQVFNSAGVTPRFVLALRDPAAVATSLRRGINRDERLTELQWLYRTTQALYHTAADCFVVHYEDWFERPVELAQGLASYVGLPDVSEEQGRQAVEKAIDQRLDRSSWQEYEVRHPLVKRLYATLRSCSGVDFERASLVDDVRECHGLIESFSWWSATTGGSTPPQASSGGKEAAVQGAGAPLSGNEQDQVLAYHKVLRELKEVQDEVAELRARLYASEPVATAAPRQTAGKQSAPPSTSAARTSGPDWTKSVRYRVGDVVVNGFSRPGRNTLRMPRALWRLAREARKQGRDDTGRRKTEITAAEQKVRESVRYRIGEVLEAAVRRPGKNTFAAPVRLIRLLREGKQRRRTRSGG
ncbi:sulfotransferase family protein [Thioalkalivibrio sp. AKL17]|uniref:sulfotransferase family protein n=1 Tax=Thioalkalivibrio sp. AKL17 TaxID=1158160 RepID=UPI000370A22F|nr:sulfotransferase family protein [Thioalkalivibrio sp. AKL17]